MGTREPDDEGTDMDQSDVTTQATRCHCRSSLLSLNSHTAPLVILNWSRLYPEAKSQKTCNQTFLSTASNSVECVSMATSPKEKLLLDYIYRYMSNDIPKRKLKKKNIEKICTGRIHGICKRMIDNLKVVKILQNMQF